MVQVLPDVGPKLATVTGNYNTTANVTWRITLGSPITANIGNYLVQSGNTANVRLLGNVISSNTVAVHFVVGNLTIGSDVLTIFNQLNNTYIGTVANVTAMEILGKVDANGNVALVNETITQSNLWIPLNTGVGLEGSTALAAEFIREEPSYIP